MPEEPPERRTRRLLAWLGCALLAGGMPVHEVEEDLLEVAAHLGHPRAQVACSPTSTTVALASGRSATFERVEGGVRLDQLAEASVLQAGLRTGAIPVEDALDRLATLRAQPHRYPRGGLLAGGILAGVGIALVLAPSWASVLFGALIAPWTVLLMILARHSLLVRTLMPFFAAFIAALIVFLAAQQGLLESPLWTMVAPIAVLLPGAVIVTGLTELAAGSIVAGTARLGHGTTQLLLFALGLGAAVVLLRVPVEDLDPARPDGLGWWGPMVGVVVVTIAISLMESVSISMVPWLLVTILATFLALTAGNTVSDAPWLGAFLGAAAASLVSTVVEFLRPQVPRVIAFLPSFWLLVPGSLGLVSLTRVEVEPEAAISAVGSVTIVVAAIALGIIVGAALARPLRSAARRIGLLPLLQSWQASRRRSSAG
ncbi:threonine/serine exporter family protein [Ornithinimicrobium ciconiae]|uniref:Threonine/serine exporter family protein n=1 Tax=Ornithinimicrobium ciconiae TaxID=2594265 RepID=A0A516G7G9_9MICO|nr:threonine/serine exporter family protein [Ornithinimicrobium ciconiae]QDO87468.1 threonine/serine exporter family protein [Ornithinimicrobium ciconiae]